MVTAFQVIVGGFALVLGIAWVIDPERMSRLQVKVMYLGGAEDPGDRTDVEKLAGRVTGAILAVLGGLILAGVLP